MQSLLEQIDPIPHLHLFDSVPLGILSVQPQKLIISHGLKFESIELDIEILATAFISGEFPVLLVSAEGADYVAVHSSANRTSVFQICQEALRLELEPLREIKPVVPSEVPGILEKARQYSESFKKRHNNRSNS